jgi:hypothetical protein
VLILVAVLLLAAHASAASLEFAEDLRIETAGTGAELGRIRDLAISADGTIFVADGGFGVIQVFDIDGSHLRGFGRHGEGPGDLPGQLIQITTDHRGNLLVAGTRSSIGRLSPSGDLIESIPIDHVPTPMSLFCLRDGRVGFTSSRWARLSASDTPAWTAQVYDAGGTRQYSFGESSWWKDEYPRHWLGGLLSSRATVDPGTADIVFVQGRPFELRRYDSDGRLLASTTVGFEGFVTEPSFPVETGTTITFHSRGGRANRVLVLADGRICVRADRIHPDDYDLDRNAEPDREIRVQRAIALYDPGLTLIAETRGEDLPMIAAVDPRGRIWSTEFDDGGVPCLARWNLRVVEGPFPRK